MENCQIVLTERQQKNQYYHLEKLINMNYLTGEEILHSDQRRMIANKYSYKKIFEELVKERVHKIKELTD